MKNRNLDNHDNWATPPDFFDKLNKKYHFNFDPCPWDHDLDLWDGLIVNWGSSNFVNPPYSQPLKEAFVKRAVEFSFDMCNSVLLLPVSTSTVLFHEVIKPNAKKIEFVRGRLRFIGINTKGQFVNYDQIQEVNKETILFEGVEIPKYVRNSGMFDSFIIEI